MVNKNTARKLIVDLPGNLSDKDVEIVTISQTTAKEAVIQTRIKTAFAVEKIKNRWVVRQVRVGDGQWENLDDLARALQEVKITATEKMIGAIAAAIESYQRQNGKPPAFKDYLTLSDALNPAYLTPLIRLDAWRRPFAAYLAYPHGIRILSAGPDGKMGTSDDIERLVPVNLEVPVGR
jgi:hypothetical protein